MIRHSLPFLAALLLVTPALASPQEEAAVIYKACGVAGGLVIHVGCGNGELTAALAEKSNTLIHALALAEPDLQTARAAVSDHYGRVAVTQSGTANPQSTIPDLPYIPNLANLVILDGATVPEAELLRVLAPNGRACARQNGVWSVTVTKPRPTNIDHWGHYLHEPDNNAVAHDTVVAPPKHFQWLGSPRWTRHHDKMSSLSALVSAGGRLFYIMDEGPTSSIALPTKWRVIARDAFNGTVLWKRDMGEWHTHLYGLKSGPAQLPRRLVATSETAYATLSINGPVTALSAETGETLRTYAGTEGTEEILVLDGTLYLVVDPEPNMQKFRDPKTVRQPWWNGKRIKLLAVDAASGDIRWQHDSPVLTMTLGVNKQAVAFHDGEKIVCLEPATGKHKWSSEPVERTSRIMSFFAPTLVLQDDILLFAGGEQSGLVKSTGGATKDDTLTAFNAKTGKQLWTAPHPPSGYSSPEDVFVRQGVVWYGSMSNGNLPNKFTGRDLRTGAIVKEFTDEIDTYWFHHRCYRGKATDNYLLSSRTGLEYTDTDREECTINHWVRGSCTYGVLPANGLTYAPPHPCACYMETKLFGFNALAGARKQDSRVRSQEESGRLSKGPAYGTPNPKSPISNPHTSWPTYRGNNARSGYTKTSIPPNPQLEWTAALGGRLSAVTVSDGLLFVAQTDRHTLHALSAETGDTAWSFTAGARIDSPPTVYKGLALFGSADGYVYALRATDGELAWKFRAAPADRMMSAFEQLESVWPVHGSVLVQDDILYCLAGRSMFLDGGVHFYKLDPQTGNVLRHRVFDRKHPDPGKSNLQDDIRWLNMPVGLPDILTSDGRNLYLRSQVMDLDGNRRELEPAGHNAGTQGAAQAGDRHLLCPIGFLDDTWFHRGYWLYGRRYGSGWSGYYVAGKHTPSGRILVHNDDTVYGYGRKPQYYRWVTPMEYQAFAAPTAHAEPVPKAKSKTNEGSYLLAPADSSLNLQKTPITVAAWIKADKPSGVVAAHGGSLLGYALYLDKGQPVFGVRTKAGLARVRAPKKLVGKWHHLAGVLHADGRLELYVDGNAVPAKEKAALLPSNPADGMSIGIDSGSLVGGYKDNKDAHLFKGLIDEFFVYHRALNAAEVAQLQTNDTSRSKDGLVLHYTFDQSAGRDASPHNNHAEAVGVTTVAGRVGEALRVAGIPGGKTQGKRSGYMVRHHWTEDVPIHARAMVLAGDQLVMAGPPDLMDEETIFKAYNTDASQVQVREQEAALLGRRGAKLLILDTARGTVTRTQPLDSPPVWDGMAAANGRLYLATMDGKVTCLGRL